MYSQKLNKTIYEGWANYQRLLVTALLPLDGDALALRPAPHLRSIEEISLHIIAARGRWFYNLMGEGGESFKKYARWDRRGSKVRDAAEIVRGLEKTWVVIAERLNAWTEAEWGMTWPGEYEGEPELITRPWVIWHLIEHDLHHGGEISLILGIHGISAIDL